MAQHDYVIDNSTGANVRADLNNALQAIVTNNSGSSAPSATFPFMLFADSAAGTMKIRNAADNAFIELFQLDGTFTLEDGSASTPALAFRDDLNTGIFSSAADTFNVATGGVERMQLGSETVFNESGANVDFRIEGDTDTTLFVADAGNDRIGIGTSSPTSKLDIAGDVTITSTQPKLFLTDTNSASDYTVQNANGNFSIVDETNSATRLHINSSGRVLLGTTTNTFTGVGSSRLQVSGTGADTSGINLIRTDNGNGGAFLQFTKNRGSATQSGDNCGAISWMGHDGTDVESYLAQIHVEAGATATSNSMTGDIVFGTANGSSITSERMRLDSNGRVLIGTTTEGEANANDLTIANSGQCGITIRSGTSNDGAIFFSDATSGSGEFRGFIQYNHTNDQLNFGESGQSRATIKGGKLGIGTTNPTELLEINLGTDKIVQFTGGIGQIGDVAGLFAVNTAKTEIADFGIMGNTLKFASGTAASGAERMRIDTSGNIIMGGTTEEAFKSITFSPDHDDGAGRITFNRADTSDVSIIISMKNASSQVGRIEHDNTSAALVSGSDYRLKENDVAISDGIARLKQLRPIRFNWKSEPSRTVDGFFAHEISSIVPEAVSGEKDAVDSDGNIIIQGISKERLVPLIVAAVQELISKVEALEAA